MGIKGMLAGPIMGLVDAGLLTVLVLITLVIGDVEGDAAAGSMCWFVPNLAIIVLAIFALKERSNAPEPDPYTPARRQPLPGPQYGAPNPQFGAPNPQYGAPNPQFGAPNPQYGAPNPQYASPQPTYRPPSVGAAAASPKQALLGVLSLAGSLDPDPAVQQAAMGRARAVATKLLGATAQPRIERQLAAPVEIMDVDADLFQHTQILVAAANAKLDENAIKAAQYVLKGADGIDPMGEEFLNTLKRQLGIHA